MRLLCVKKPTETKDEYTINRNNRLRYCHKTTIMWLRSFFPFSVISRACFVLLSKLFQSFFHCKEEGLGLGWYGISVSPPALPFGIITRSLSLESCQTHHSKHIEASPRPIHSKQCRSILGPWLTAVLPQRRTGFGIESFAK